MKGVEYFFEIADSSAAKNFDLLLMIPDLKNISLTVLQERFGKRLEIVTGKTVSAYSPIRGDIHLYPADHSTDAKFVESMSLNCLELTCLGTPTLLTKNGLLIWSKFEKSRLFWEVDWKDRPLVEDVLTHATQEIPTLSQIYIAR